MIFRRLRYASRSKPKKELGSNSSAASEARLSLHAPGISQSRYCHCSLAAFLARRMMKYLSFEQAQLKSKKTLDVFVKSQSGTILGTIKWYAHWRRYVFHPTLLVGTSFDSNCLKELTEYLDSLMRQRS